MIDGDDEALRFAGSRAFDVLEGTVRAPAERHNPGLDVRTAAQLCWSAMQGLIELHPKMARRVDRR